MQSWYSPQQNNYFVKKNITNDLNCSYVAKPALDFALCSASRAFNSFRSTETGSDPRFKTLYDYERESLDLHNKTEAIITAGKKDEAAELLRAKLEAVKESMNAGTMGTKEVVLLYTIAWEYKQLGDMESVDSILRLLSEALDGLRDDERPLDIVLVAMGKLYLSVGNFKKAVLIFQRAIDLTKKKFGKNCTLLVPLYLGMARSVGSLNEISKAIEFYRSAITITESGNKGVEIEDLIMSLSELGCLLLCEGKVKEAEDIYERQLNVCTTQFGEYDRRVAIAMHELGQAKHALGDVDEAIRLFRNAIRVFEDSNSTNYTHVDDSTVECIRIDLAELLQGVGRDGETREVLQECVQTTQKNGGEEDMEMAKHMYNLGASHYNSGNFSEAEHFFRTSMEIMTKIMGPCNPIVTLPMLSLAMTLHQLGYFEKAEQLASEALQIREKEIGQDSLGVADALNTLLVIQFVMGKDDELLLEKLKRLLRIQEKELGYECEKVHTTLERMSYCLSRLGRKDELFAVRKRLSLLRAKFR